MNCKGNCCSCCTWADFAKLNDDAWLEEMIRNFSLVSADGLADAQCRAWISSRKVLKKALKKLPAAYGETWLVFEYVLPMHKPGTKKAENEKGIRPDVLIVGRDFVTVLEFKQRKKDPDGSVYEGYITQAGKYVTRLNRYHSLARDTYVAPVVVMTLEKNLLDDRDSVVICSGDRLADAVLLLNGDSPDALNREEMDRWLAALD